MIVETDRALELWKTKLQVYHQFQHPLDNSLSCPQVTTILLLFYILFFLKTPELVRSIYEATLLPTSTIF